MLKNPLQSIYRSPMDTLYFYPLSDGVLCFGQSQAYRIQTNQFNSMKSISHIFNFCEQLFDELVKELLLNRFDVVSASYRTDGHRKVRARKAHLRKRKR